MRRKGAMVDHESTMLDLNEERAPLSIDRQEEQAEPETGKPLDERILELVAKSPSKVYATRLITELGLSHEDASAELCGLMAAVGSGASFKFESMENNELVMCFSFPSDFVKKARQSRSKHERRQTFWKSMIFLAKVLKIVTAFGLILSLLIVTVAAMVGLVAVMVAMSRSNGGGHDRHLSRRLRDMFFTIRQLLWCYAMFGHHVEGQDPFLSEIAYDLSLTTSICCGNPGSIWFWWRTQQLSRRRRYMGRSWGRLVQQQTPEEASHARQWDMSVPSPDPRRDDSDEHRGLLSLAVEFLFGPVPFAPGPSEMDKWKLRAAIITEESTKSGSVTLRDLSPFMDDPPTSLDDEDDKLKVGGLAIVTHFHGMPKQGASDSQHRFVFPELMAESAHASNYVEPLDSDNGTWQAVLYVPDVIVWSPPSRLPSSLQERRYRLTKMGSKQFLSCVVVGTLNLIGVLWLSASLNPGGVLSDFLRVPAAIRALKRTLIPVLEFYAVLFFTLPAGRFAVITSFNSVREARNQKRADLAHALSTAAATASTKDPEPQHLPQVCLL